MKKLIFFCLIFILGCATTQLKVNSPIIINSNLENVFIGGDALRGPATVIEAIADGKSAAGAIIRKENLNSSEFKQISFDFIKLEQDIINRKGIISFQNINDLHSESTRCLECSFICNKCVEVCPNRTNIAIQFFNSTIPQFHDSQVKFKDKYQILHVDGMCNECGNCETFCPYNGSPYKEKFTLFWEEKNFLHSKNDGFICLPETSEKIAVFRIRIKSNVGIVKYDKMSKLIKSDSNLISDDNFTKFINIVINIYIHYSYLLIAK